MKTNLAETTTFFGIYTILSPSPGLELSVYRYSNRCSSPGAYSIQPKQQFYPLYNVTAVVDVGKITKVAEYGRIYLLERLISCDDDDVFVGAIKDGDRSGAIVSDLRVLEHNNAVHCGVHVREKF